MSAAGDAFELSVTPDRYLTVRYAGASGDFNPIHIDDEFARSVGLPGRILHGLWSMAQVARAHTEAFGGPEALAALSVQFRGLGVPEQEIMVHGTVSEVSDDRLRTRAEATQGGTRIVRGAVGEVRAVRGALSPPSPQPRGMGPRGPRAHPN
jgi:acyl dehydratase